MSVASAGCVVWLERFQPLFVSVSRGYARCIRRGSCGGDRLTVGLAGCWCILWTSLGTSIAVGAALVALWLRYR